MAYFSFIILCYNNWNYSKQAITSLIESLKPTYFERGIELIIVNNGSEDDTYEGILEIERKYQGYIQIIPVHKNENLGYPIGINCGLEHCTGEIITIINNDLIFPENWFDELIKTIEGDSSIGIAVPYLSYATGHQHAGFTFQSLNQLQDFARSFMDSHKENIIFLDRVIGACMVFRKRVIELVGGNDFWFGIGNYDDDDWSLRVRISGYNIALVGGSFVHHIGSTTFKQVPQAYQSALTSNHYKFFKKWNFNNLDEKARQELIFATPFEKENHFYPVKIEQFNQPVIDSRPQDVPLKILVVADWSSPISNWKEKLTDIVSNMIDDAKLTFWIPSKYYEYENYQNEIKQIVNKPKLDLNFLHDDIPHINLLIYLSGFDKFVTIESDFVNRYIKSLSQHCFLDLI